MSRTFRLTSLFSCLFLVFSLVAVDFAEARRGGSFGSRGTRTFQAPAATQTAPRGAAPVQRSMTPNQTNPAGAQTRGAAQGTPAAASRRGLFGGLGGGLLGGLMLGGLFGLLMGTGFGGLGGIFALLVQALLIGLGIFLLMRLFGGRRTAHAGGRSAPASGGASPMRREAYATGPGTGGDFRIPSIGSGGAAAAGAAHASRDPASPSDEIGITDKDLDMFEQRLQEVQAAFTREDYAALRRITTPEVMSYLAEELSENAVAGRRNEVSDVTLLQGDLSEAWREGENEFATVAMRYTSRDVMRDRETGAILEGDPDEASETTEHWTFVRSGGEPWKLTAIQG